MPYDDDSMVMISALQHYIFCPRQCALIHLEQLWNENFLTAAGRVMHERVDSGIKETRGDVHKAMSLRLFSHQLGITGVADLVEFYREKSATDGQGNVVAVKLTGKTGYWRPCPVEYKHGKPKDHRADEVQLCAQAISLEEMLSVKIHAGMLYYGQTKRRVDVVFDEQLRTLTQRTADALHEMMDSGVTPQADYSKSCDACSLEEICFPKLQQRGLSAARWFQSNIEDSLK